MRKKFEIGSEGYSATGGKWKAQISVNGQHISLGRFRCFTEAVAHRLAAEQAVDWAGCDSCSSAYQYMKEYLNENT